MPIGSTAELAQFPRAAFLDRAAAFVIDVVLVLFVVNLLDASFRYREDEIMFPMLLAYFIGFWVWKGTTIGGIVTNLRVVKINGGVRVKGLSVDLNKNAYVLRAGETAPPPTLQHMWTTVVRATPRPAAPGLVLLRHFS